jgi:hypothetical protein
MSLLLRAEHAPRCWGAPLMSGMIGGHAAGTRGRSESWVGRGPRSRATELVAPRSARQGAANGARADPGRGSERRRALACHSLPDRDRSPWFLPAAGTASARARSGLAGRQRSCGPRRRSTRTRGRGHHLTGRRRPCERAGQRSVDGELPATTHIATRQAADPVSPARRGDRGAQHGNERRGGRPQPSLPALNECGHRSGATPWPLMWTDRTRGHHSRGPDTPVRLRACAASISAR